MEATVAERRSSHAVGFGQAFRAQFGLLGWSRRPLVLFVALLGLLALAGEPWNQSPLARFLNWWPLWVVPIGPLWAFAVFHNEGPSDRLYFWSQPVARHTHSLARLGAGVAWLWIAYALLILAGLVFGLLDGNAWQLAELGPAAWANYFAAPAIGFLGVSLLTLTTDHPIRWTLGLILGFGIVTSFAHESLGLADEVEWLLQPLSEEWGLGMTLVGPLGTEVARVGHLIERMADPAVQFRSSFDVRLWWTAMPLWLLFFAGLVVAAATWHPDVFPHWPRRR
ncbi:MAG: hypothetical protein P8177_04825 [Gemmatimonadota bacterium]|jgi:hypothetical protein